MKTSTAVHSGVLAVALSGGIAFGQMTIVNSASYDSTGPLAPGSFATVLGKNLCGQTVAGRLDSNGMYPITLGG